MSLLAKVLCDSELIHEGVGAAACVGDGGGAKGISISSCFRGSSASAKLHLFLEEIDFPFPLPSLVLMPQLTLLSVEELVQLDSLFFYTFFLFFFVALLRTYEYEHVHTNTYT